MTRRRLTAGELDLWKKVADTAERLRPDTYNDELSPPPRPISKGTSTPVKKFAIGATAKNTPVRHNTLPVLSERIAQAPVNMDRKAFDKLKRGKLVPEGKLDLHGMTLDRAHGALTRYILQAHSAGKRLILIVTGKGKDRDDGGPIPVRRGVLRHNVPGWLATPPLSQVVLQISEAHVKHGGGGAYYVYLRRQK